MKLKDINKATELLETLQQGLDQQQELLMGLQASLVDYQMFLINCMKEARDEN